MTAENFKKAYDLIVAAEKEQKKGETIIYFDRDSFLNLKKQSKELFNAKSN